MKRRGFLGMLGLGAAVASPNVKQSEPLPATPAAVETFAGGYLKHLKQPAAVDNWGWFDVRDGILYDRVRFEAGQSLPSHLRLFQAPLGQPCPYTHRVKTLLDTNMHNAGQLCAPNEFLARDVIFAAHPSVSQSDLEILSAGAYWELWLLQKRMASGPMLLNGPARAELSDIVDDAGKPRPELPAEVNATAYHQPVTGGLLIPTQAYFALDIHFPDYPRTLSLDGRGLDLLVGFVGLDARGVQ